MMSQLKLHFTRQNKQINSFLLQLYSYILVSIRVHTVRVHACIYRRIFLYIATAIAQICTKGCNSARAPSFRLPVLSAYHYILLKACHVVRTDRKKCIALLCLSHSIEHKVHFINVFDLFMLIFNQTFFLLIEANMISTDFRAEFLIKICCIRKIAFFHRFCGAGRTI